MLDNFQKAGVRLVKPEFALAEIRITFSEDWQDHVWVAEIRQGPSTQTVIKRFAKLPKTTSSRAPLLTIRKNLVWQQEGPILDFAMDGPNLFVLEPDQLTVYVNDGGKWRAQEALAPFPHPPVRRPPFPPPPPLSTPVRPHFSCT